MTGDERDDPDDDLADSDTSDEYPIPPPDPDAVIDGERGGEGQDTAGVPDSDPRHIDPAGDLADAVESGELGIELSDDQDVDDLREFLDAVDAGEFDPVDPGLEATVRIVRELLDEDDVDDETDGS